MYARNSADGNEHIYCVVIANRDIAADEQILVRYNQSGNNKRVKLAHSSFVDAAAATNFASSPSASISISPSPFWRKVKIGNLCRDLYQMTDSTADYHSARFDILRLRLRTDGFLFIRQVIPARTIAAARNSVLAHLASKGAIRSGTDVKDAIIAHNVTKSQFAHA